MKLYTVYILECNDQSF